MEPKQVEIETLNQQAAELSKDCSAEQAIYVKEPMTNVNLRWDMLIGNIADREVQICYFGSFFFFLFWNLLFLLW